MSDGTGPDVGLIFERAAVEDAEEILRLQKLAYRSQGELYDDFTIPPLVQTVEEVRIDLQRQVVLKAVSRGRIVGSVRAHAQQGTCFIGRLIVHPDFQNRGIGTWLMEKIERAFGQAQRFELFTGHRSERPLRLYRKLGYRAFRSERVHDDLTLIFLEKEIRT